MLRRAVEQYLNVSEAEVNGTESAAERNKIVGGELFGAAGRRGGLSVSFPRFEYCWLSFFPLIFQSFLYMITSPIKSPLCKGGGFW